MFDDPDKTYRIVYPPDTEIFETPDTPPSPTWADVYWYFTNRAAESAMRLFRMWRWI